MLPIMDNLVTQYGGTLSHAVIQKRLDARTVKGPGCWEIQGAAVQGGYVHIGVITNGRQRLFKAHRVAWELANGPIPEGMRVLHACDNPRCVNPKHLSVGTQAENVHDSIQKGRYKTYGRQKLNAQQVHEIRALAIRGERQKDIAARFGIKRHTVSGILHGKSWAHLPQQPTQTSDAQVAQALGPLYGPNSPLKLVPSVQVRIAGEVR